MVVVESNVRAAWPMQRSSATMFPFQRILVATDFGPSSQRAVDTALTLAIRCHAAVTLLHVWEVPTFSYSGLAYSVQDVLAPIKAKAQVALDEAVARASHTVPSVHGELRSGTPWSVIQEAIFELGPDVVVLGTHGRSWIARAFLGSVAERTVRMSLVPVVTVRAAPDHEKLDGREAPMPI